MSIECYVDLVVSSSTSQYPEEDDAVTAINATEDLSATVTEFFHLYVIAPNTTSRELVPPHIRNQVRFLLVRNLHNTDSVDLTYYTTAQPYPTTSIIRVGPGRCCYLTNLTGNTSPSVLAARNGTAGTETFNLEVIGGGY